VTHQVYSGVTHEFFGMECALYLGIPCTLTANYRRDELHPTTSGFRRPANILTPDALTLRHAPIADCARYDNLRKTI
jgi:hypothetical protein